MVGSPRSRLAFDALLETLASRRVHTVVVEVIPAWIRVAEPEMLTHRANVAAATAHGFPVVSVSEGAASHSTHFSHSHLSAEGNVFVADAVRSHFAKPQLAPVQATPLLGNRTGVGGAQQAQVECALGAAVHARTLVADGFREVDIDNGRVLEHPKLAMEGSRVGASLELCAISSATRLHKGGAIFIGYQHSHKLNVPVVGVAHAWCEGACVCAAAKARQAICSAEAPCAWDTLHASMVTVTVFQELQLKLLRALPAAERVTNGTACTCRVHVRVAPTADGRSRVLVRALVVAPDALSAAGAARGLRAFGVHVAEQRRRRLLSSDDALGTWSSLEEVEVNG
jgi:hypothetical protein